ncbi:MAG: HEPN domain-containing protein [Phormidesmis sp.]
MKFNAQAWLDKANSTFETAHNYLELEGEPNYNAICLFNQWCAEQYLKARLQKAEIPFGDCQPLPSLLDAVLPIEPTRASMQQVTKFLLTKGSEFGYPGSIVSQEIAENALESCSQIREVVRASLLLNT